MKYSIATLWDNDYLEKLDLLNNGEIKEVFGCRTTKIIGQGRVKDSVPLVSREEAEGHIKYAKKKSFEFNYLLNDPNVEYLNPRQRDLKKERELRKYIDWIADQEVNRVTVADQNLMRLLTKYYPGLEIKVSQIAGIRKREEILRYKEMFPGIAKVGVDSALNRSVELLAEAVNTTHGIGVEIELLANESCILNCPYKKEHYAFVAREAKSAKRRSDKKFHHQCNLDKAKNPFLLLGAPWIRPEDVEYFETGFKIDWLKIAGREKSKEYLLRVAKAYTERSFEGKFLDLLAVTQDIDLSQADENLKVLFDIDNKMIKLIGLTSGGW